MTEPLLTLEYEMTLSDVRAEFRRMDRRSSSFVLRFCKCLLGLVVLCLAVRAWQDGRFWIVTFCLLGGVYFVYRRQILHLWLLSMIARTYGTSTIRLAFDDRGILFRNCAHRFGQRQWWSRLTKCEEVDGGFEMSFDGKDYPSLRIPPRAFVDDDKRGTLRSLIEQHLPAPNSTAVAG